MPVTAQRIVFPGAGEVTTDLCVIHDPGPHQLLVRTDRTAVSAGTEMTGLLGVHPVNRAYPVYPGYSHVGVVEAVGAGVTGVRVGDRVLSMGGHQSYLLLDCDPNRPDGPAYVEQVPDSVPSDQAAFAILGSVALHGIRRARLQVGAATVVFGQGIVGQLLVQLARLSGCSPIIAVDTAPDRLERSRISGADVVVRAGQEDVAAAVGQATEGRGAEAVFDATRTPATLPIMMKVAAVGGTVLVVGSLMGTVEIDAFVDLQLKELSIVGCYQPAAPLQPHHTFPWTQARNRRIILAMMSDGRLRLDHLITHVVPATAAPAVFAMMERGPGGWLGVVLTWNEPDTGTTS